MALLQSLLNGNGTMAQFNHRELGGGGQWMRGGMTMVGDMFNHGLKAKVEGLCSELSQLLAQQPFAPSPPSFQSKSQAGHQQQQQGGHVGAGSVSLFVPEAPGRAAGQWWPAELGFPNGSGGQNQVRYAYFNSARRLAVELSGHVTVYDSLDHEISGVSQQQGSQGSLTFTSQYGTVSVSSLPIVSMDGAPGDPPNDVGRLPRRSWNPTVVRLPRKSTYSPRSSGLQTCNRRALSHRRSSPPRRPSFCHGCERNAAVV